MKLKEMLGMIRSTWINQDNGIDGRVTIELITCPIDDYAESPSDYLGDLICAYASDYMPETFLTESLLNRNVLGIAARNTDHIIIRIEENNHERKSENSLIV